MHGSGTFTFSLGQKVIAEFKDGERQGKGQMRFPKGETYDGTYVDGLFTGPCKLFLLVF